MESSVGKFQNEGIETFKRETRPDGPDDIQNTMAQQILPIKVQGQWDFITIRKPIYVSENSQEIDTLFAEKAAIGK